jgi:hypothetical protein
MTWEEIAEFLRRQSNELYVRLDESAIIVEEVTPERIDDICTRFCALGRWSDEMTPSEIIHTLERLEWGWTLATAFRQPVDPIPDPEPGGFRPDPDLWKQVLWLLVGTREAGEWYRSFVLRAGVAGQTLPPTRQKKTTGNGSQ